VGLLIHVGSFGNMAEDYPNHQVCRARHEYLNLQLWFATTHVIDVGTPVDDMGTHVIDVGKPCP
jgi:hypothetical protein